MSVKENSDYESTFVMLFDEEWQPAAHELSTAITPAGLPLARQLYLYKQIREYCRDGTEYLVCPNPHLANHVHSPDCHRPKISMGELLHHTRNECGNEESGIFRGIQRDRVRNSRTQLNILSTSMLHKLRFISQIMLSNTLTTL